MGGKFAYWCALRIGGPHLVSVTKRDRWEAPNDYWKGVSRGRYTMLFLAAFSGVMRAGPLKSGVHLFLLTNITCTEFFQTYRFTPKGLQQHPQNGSVGRRKAIKFRQIDRFSQR